MSVNFGLTFFAIVAAISLKGQADALLSTDSLRPLGRIIETVPENRTATIDNTIFRVYGNDSLEPASYLIGDVKQMLSDPNLVLSRPTVVYAHGYVELTTDESVVTIVKAYQAHGGYNIIVVDWSNLAFGNYIIVAGQLKPLGKQVGQAITTLLGGCISLERLHLVGHSLGAHVVGFIARKLQESGFVVPRLTGLDPAFPGFYPPLLSASVSPGDAKFVDIIHTNGGGFGTPVNTGHADFFPNGGKAPQPGCPILALPLTTEGFCSHWRSWRFFAESLIGGNFLACPCGSEDEFKRGSCHDAQLVPMGQKADPKYRGTFYLTTAASKPYALGEKGANP